MLIPALRFLFFDIFIRAITGIVLGLNVRHRERLPSQGPAVIAANHNSHLDTMVLMTLFPRGVRDRVRPVAAADYFLRNRLLAWFSTRIIGILPIQRSRNPGDPDPIAQLAARLDQGDIIIFFPEGTRGEPERLAEFKTGLARLKQQRPQVPVIPVFMHGLGKALPKGEAMLVPFFVDVFVGAPVAWTGDRDSYLSAFRTAMSDLAAEGNFPEWQ